MTGPRDEAALIERYYAATTEGDFDTVVTLHAPDVVCWMAGETVVSGRFQGREALFEHMIHHVLGGLVGGSESYVKAARVVIVDPPFVVGLMHGGLPNATGGRYDQRYLQIFRIGDGLIREIVEIFDTAMFEEAVAGNRLTRPREKPATPFAVLPPLSGARDKSATLALAQGFVAAIETKAPDQIEALLSPGAQLGMIGTTPLSGFAAADSSRLTDVLAGEALRSRIVCADQQGAVLFLHPRGEAGPRQIGVLIEPDGAGIGRISVFEDTLGLETHRFSNPLRTAGTARIMPPFDLWAAFAE
jgi:ketosteroid isomerase-like protein